MLEKKPLGTHALVFFISIVIGLAVIAFFSLWLLIGALLWVVLCAARGYHWAAVLGVAVGVILLVVAFYNMVLNEIRWLDPRTWFGGF